MSTSVIEALQNAQINFKNVERMGGGRNPIFMIAMDQLNNGIAALENGLGIDDVIQESFGAPLTIGTDSLAK